MTENITPQKIKLAFFGTSTRTEPILNSLNNNFNLFLCITKPDVYVGRNKVVSETGVKKWSRVHNIPVMEVDTFKNSIDNKVISELEKRKINFGIVADFSFIIPESIINYFEKKLLNIHFSLLPKYRGAAPIQHAILNNEKKTGITIQMVDIEVDKGAVIYQYEYNLPFDKTSGEIYKELFNITGDILPNILNNYANGLLKPIAQNENEATYTYSKTHPNSTAIYKEDAKIDWNASPINIYNLIRAFNPWPIAYSTLEEFQEYLKPRYLLKSHVDKNLLIKIHRAKFENGQIEFTQLQVEGRNIVGWKDFKNGYLSDAS